MLKWAEKVGEVIVDGVAEGSPQSLQQLVGIFQDQDRGAVPHQRPEPADLQDLTVEDVAESGSRRLCPGTWRRSSTPPALANGLRFRATGTGLANAQHPSSSASSDGERRPGDGHLGRHRAQVLTIQIDSGVTTADAVVAALAGLGSPWTAQLTEGGGTGFDESHRHQGAPRTSRPGFGHTIPLQFDMSQNLLARLAGDNNARRRPSWPPPPA
jgi:hypothetical protein